MTESEHEMAIDAARPDELGEYRPVCIPAFVGLLVALLTPLAFIHPVAWVVPILTAAISLYALYLLSNSEPLSGRWAALVALVLAIVIGTWAPVRAYSYEVMTRRDAERFAQLWFAFLAHGEPQKAFQLTVAPGERSPLDETLWNSYRTRTAQRQGLEGYLQNPLVRTLMALGERAQVRRFDVEMTLIEGKRDIIEDVYAITFDDAGKRQTFFVRFQMTRNTSPAEGPLEWRILGAEGGILPQALGGNKMR